MSIQADPLFAGVTRPTMIWGVSYEAMIVNFMFTSILFVGSGNPLLIMVALPIHGIAYLVCLKDPRAFRFFYLWIITKGRSITRTYWGASTATPFSNPRRNPSRL